MLVFSLCALVFGGITFSIVRALKAEQFSGGVKKVIQKIELARLLSLDYQADVLVKFEKSGNGLRCRLVGDQRVPEALLKNINKEEALSPIRSFLWEGEKLGTFSLHFSVTDHPFPLGTLTLKGKKGQHYPLTFANPWNLGKPIQDNFDDEEAPYPQEILSAT